MSVNYDSCDCCGESIYDEYISDCNKCDQSLCTDCLVNNDINSSYAFKYGYKFDSKNPKLMKKYKKEGFDLYGEDKSPYYKDGDIIGDSYIDSKYCPFCNKEEVSDSMIIDYFLKKYSLKKEDIIEIIKK